MSNNRLSPEAEAELAKYRPGYIAPPPPVNLWKRIGAAVRNGFHSKTTDPMISTTEGVK